MSASALVLAVCALPRTASAQTGLVAAYSFDEGAGTTAADASGSGNNGTVANATWTTAGKYGKAIVFNGSSSRVSAPDSPSLRLTTAMTLEAWVNPSASGGGWRDVVYKANDNYFLMSSSTNSSRPAGGGTFGEVYGTTSVAAGAWTHLAVTYDGANLRMFVNGTQVQSVAQTGPIATSSNPLTIGSDAVYGQYFGGTIDEVRVYSVALTQAQIQTDMNTPIGAGVPDTQPPTAPGSLAATAVGSNRIDLSWTASTDNVGVTGYLVERCLGASCSTFAQVATSSTITYSDTGLAATTSYSYRVRATDAAGNLSPYSNVASATTATPDTTPPSAPGNLAATAVGSSQIDLSWTAAIDDVGVTGYLVERCQGASCTTFAQIATPTATSYSNTGLTASTSYSYRVRATDAAGNLGPYSGVASATTGATPDTQPPTAPSNLAGTPVGSTQANLSWTASIDNVGVTGYRLERCQGGSCTSFVQIATPTGTTYTDTGLTPATRYRYRVRATDAAGNLSAYSNIASVLSGTADTTPPSAPSNLAAVAAGTSQINLTWTASTDNVGVTGYRVERCQGASCTTFAQIATPTATAYGDTGLTAGTTYRYRVRATDAAGNLSAYSGIASATTAQVPDTEPPTAPTGLLATASGSSQINLSWTASTDNVGVTGYRVERCLGAGCSSFAEVGTPTGTTFGDTGLAPTTSYSYRVRATDAAGNLSPYSGVASATTTAAVSGLVAAYGFDEGSGSTVTDVSGQGNHGTIANATWTASGRFGQALVFNGSNAWVTVADSPSLRLTTAMTLEAWVRPTVVNGAWRDVVYKADDNYFLMATGNAGVPVVGGTFAEVSGPTALAANAWSHVAVTYDKVTLRLYVNGTQVASVASTANIATSANPLRIGGDSIYGQYFTGTIDEVRVYNVALSAAQVASDMNTAVGNGVPDTQPPTAPSGLTATAAGTQVNLAWTAATDNVGVTGYQVERCQGAGCTAFAQVGAPTGTTFSDPGLAAGTTYRYQVRATDAAGNLGPYSNIAEVTTAAPDTEPPTAPTGLAATAVNGTQVNLTWGPAQDNVGVTGYRVERCQGAGCSTFAQVGAPAGTSYNDTGLATNTSYSYRVRATDAAGNLGPYSNVASATTPATIPGLVAAYSFDEGAGTTVADASGNGNGGTLANTTWTAAGRFGSALVFNGSSSWVTINDVPMLRLTTAMTLEAWVKPALVTATWRDVIYKANDDYFMMATSNNSVPVGGGTFGEVAGPNPLPLNTWTHVAVTYDKVNLRLYVNGTQAASVPRTTTISTSNNPVRIGGDALYGQFFNGTIDEIRIYNVALTAAQVQSDMNAPVGPGGPPPIDTTPPVVSITAPAAGSDLSGTVTLSANASDAGTGVGGVQFQVDGLNVGGPASAPPYSISLNTAQFGNGAHAIAAYAWDNARNVGTAAPVSVTFSNLTPGAPQVTGLWSGLFSWPLVAVHAHLMRTGQVLASDGQDAGTVAVTWDPVTSLFRDVSAPDNIFCAGHAALADGRIFIAGGHAGGHIGLPVGNIFDPVSLAWTTTPQMTYQRWYPTVTMLPDGRALVTQGETSCAGCNAGIPEIYNPTTNSWSLMSSANLPMPYYPHMYLLPDGRVYAAGTSEAPITTRVLNLTTQSWSTVESSGLDGGSSAMYLPGKILKCGTSVDPDNPGPTSAATSYVIDMTQPTPSWRTVAPMAFRRTYHTLTLLPDGNVLATGGGTTTNAVGVANGVLAAEVWSPSTETWTTLASMHAPRLYHSLAMLMPDARVLVAGGGRFNGTNEPTDQLSGEIFAPPYLFKGPRPTIADAPAQLTYNQPFTVQTPDAANVAKVVLMGTASVTHAINMNQRYVPLGFTAGAGTLQVTAPLNANYAPPGYYMLFIIDNNGVPSVARFVKL